MHCNPECVNSEHNDGHGLRSSKLTHSAFARKRGVRLIETPEQCGKQYVQVLARDLPRGEILVFANTRVELEPDGSEKISPTFVDPGVGCESSKDPPVEKKKSWMGEQPYAQLEMRIRRLESRTKLAGYSLWEMLQR